MRLVATILNSATPSPQKVLLDSAIPEGGNKTCKKIVGKGGEGGAGRG